MGNLYNLAMNVFKIGSDYYLIEPNKDYTFSINDNNKVNITKFVRNKYSNFSFNVFRPQKKDYIEKYMLKQEYIESLGIDYKNYCKDRDKIVNVKLI